MCLAFGIRPYDKSKGKGKTVSHHEWEHQKRGTSWKQKLRAEIDSLIGGVKNLDELIYELELKGYEVKKEIDSREMVLCVKQISTTRLLPEYDKPYVIEPFSLSVDKLRVKPVGKK